MMLPSRLASLLSLRSACAAVIAGLYLSAAVPVFAQDMGGEEAPPTEAPAGETPAAETPADAPAAETAAKPDAAATPLGKSVEDFWHFAKIARYDVAALKGQDVLAANADPLALLEAFEAVATQRGDILDEWLLRWQNIDAIKPVAEQINAKLKEGRFARRGTPEFIEKNVIALGTNDRAYARAVGELRESGELAVPTMLRYLMDPQQTRLHGPIRRAMREMGQLVLNPLVVATSMKNTETLPGIISLLVELGYPDAAPYLAKLAESEQTPAPIRASAKAGVARLTSTPNAKASDLFYQLAEKLYYDRASIVADKRFPTASVWYYEEGKGLLKRDVPPVIFNEIASMRAAADALETGAGADALALWLDANYKREAELPSGATDTTAPPNPAHYYGVTAGVQYLEMALTRALRDRNAAVALAAVKSLQEIVGESSALAGRSDSPLIAAMQYPDRRVRFEAALTLAAALPQKDFNGQEQVVPLLAEAITQTGNPSVLVVLPTQEQVNAVVEPLKAENYNIVGGTTAAAAITAAANIPGIDVILISDELSPVEIETLLGQASQSPKLRGAAKLFLVKSQASQWERRKVSDPLIATTTAADAAGLKPAIADAREQSGALPLDPELAEQYAIRSGEMIKRLAVGRNPVLDVSTAKSALLTALGDTRPEIVKLAGDALAMIKADEAQPAILTKATADGTTDDVKVSLFKAIATSAKLTGSKLDATAVTTLDTAVKDSQNADVRAAAAEARGALNLPANQAQALILEQMKR